MKEETDLRAVKALAHAMLELDIEQTRLSPLVVKHPFTDNGISGVRKPPLRNSNMRTNPLRPMKRVCSLASIPLKMSALAALAMSAWILAETGTSSGTPGGREDQRN